MNEVPYWKHKLPLFISSLFVIAMIYMLGWSWTKSASLIFSQYYEKEIVYGSFIFGESTTFTYFHVLLYPAVSGFAWLLSTRVNFYQSKWLRVSVFLGAMATSWGTILGFGLTKVSENIIPFFQGRLLNVIEIDGFFESIVFEQTRSFYFLLMLIPLIILSFSTVFLLSKYMLHDKDLNAAFLKYEWSGKWLQKLSGLEKREKWPDVELGPDSFTGEMVVIPGRDRTLNTSIVGAIGTGKTAALGLPLLKQDLDHLVDYINDYPKVYKRDDFKTEEVGGRYMSGISVIDPSNDLCQDTLKLVRAHGIPDEAITYINPLDANTPSINPMRGPVDKVAEVFAQVIAGLNDSNDGGSFFFEQAQRNHLKHYIYLLKLHDEDKEVTLDMLLDMYNNPTFVRSMHVMLKKTFPPNYEEFEDRDERNYWKIIQGIDEWFDLNLLPKKTRQETFERNENNEILYYDAKEEHVQGLRNILNDIGANPLIRRVLFGKSDFDFDRHMEIGGVLLVNTAKGELVDLARVLGKIVLMNLQNATFRRAPRVSSFHHIMIDEAPDYLYKAFREFPAQSRKYKVTITTLKQTIAQLADQFGEHYMTTIIGAMRHRMVYGDVPAFDADYFSKMFGEKFVYDESQNEMQVSPLQEDPMSRSGSSYSKLREEAMTSGDIMFQDAFQCAVKIVIDNQPMPVTQISANFVPKEEFIKSKVVAKQESLDVWLRERRLYGVKATEEPEELLSIEETETINAEFYDDVLDPEMIDRAVSAKADPHPRGDIKYLKEDQAVEPVVTVEPTQNVIDVAAIVAAEAEQGQELNQKHDELNVPTASAVNGLLGVRKWTDEVNAPPSADDAGVATEEPEAIHLDTEPVMRSGYEESQLSEENKKFVEKFGEGVREFDE